MSSLKNVKVALPTYSEVVPSSKETIKIHPFKVGDEKVLLMASESKDQRQMASSLKQVIKNCSEGFDVDQMTSFDMEYLFLRIRAISVGEVADIGLKCSSCETVNEINVDLQSVKIKEFEGHKTSIKVSDDLAFKMKYPSIEDIASSEGGVQGLLNLIVMSVETVFFGDEVIEVTPAEHDDLRGIIESLTTTQFNSIQQFFETSPKLIHDLDFNCGSCGAENKQKLEGLAAFF